MKKIILAMIIFIAVGCQSDYVGISASDIHLKWLTWYLERVREDVRIVDWLDNELVGKSDTEKKKLLWEIIKLMSENWETPRPQLK